MTTGSASGHVGGFGRSFLGVPAPACSIVALGFIVTANRAHRLVPGPPSLLPGISGATVIVVVEQSNGNR